MDEELKKQILENYYARMYADWIANQYVGSWRAEDLLMWLESNPEIEIERVSHCALDDPTFDWGSVKTESGSE